MLRRVFTILSVLSLMLCVAAVAMWVQGRRAHTALIFARQGGRLWMLHTYCDRLWLYKHDQWPVSEGPHWRTAPAGQVGGIYNVAVYGAYGSWEKNWSCIGVLASYGTAALEVARDGQPIWVDGQPDDFSHHLMPAPFWTVGVPFWMVVTATLLAPTAWVTRTALRRRSRVRCRQVCQICGYDLRAAPTRCPECGDAA